MKRAKYFDTCERCGLEEEISETKQRFTVPVIIRIDGETGKKDLCPACVLVVKAAFDAGANVGEPTKKSE